MIWIISNIIIVISLRFIFSHKLKANISDDHILVKYDPIHSMNDLEAADWKFFVTVSNYFSGNCHTENNEKSVKNLLKLEKS